MKLKQLIPEIILLIVSLLICIGSFTFFSACPVHGDTVMACHWAQNAVTTLGTLLLAMSLAAVVVPDRKIKAGLELSATLTAILTAIVPGVVINICMMNSMRCVSTFRPFTILLASLTAVAALLSAVINLKRKEK
jgi:hypothetical protein